MRNQVLDKFFLDLDENVVAKLVDQVMPGIVPPANLLVPPEVWKENTKKEMRDLLSGKDLKQKIESGFEEIVKDLQMHITKPELKHIQEEWELSVSKLEAVCQDSNPMEINEETSIIIQDVLGISDQTYEHFYSVGRRLYEGKRFDKAANVFFILTLLNYTRFNVWLSLGLCEKQNKNMDQALHAFAMATLCNIESALPLVYSAECCFESGNSHEASSYLDFATQTLNHFPDSNPMQISSLIEKVKAQFK